MKISVVIPVKNGASTLDRCLSSLRNQTIGNDLEIIILDSMSTDNSTEIALKYGATVIAIQNGTFDHGLTRNIGVANVTGELVYLTVQDAWILENDMLERMSKHFDDSQIMGVTGHQAVPHEKDKNPVLWYRRYSDFTLEMRQVNDVELFKKKLPSEQAKLIAWDNVVAMYRRSALIALPFVQTGFAEDWKWSYDALLRGWNLMRDSSLLVYHYHHATMSYSFRSTYTISYHFYKFFGYKPSLPSVLLPTLKSIYHLVRNKELNFYEKLYWSLHNMGINCSNFFSIADFKLRMKLFGEKGITAGFNKYCKSIPMGREKNNSSDL